MRKNAKRFKTHLVAHDVLTVSHEHCEEACGDADDVYDEEEHGEGAVCMGGGGRRGIKR